jgi:pyruvate dehydrogenase E2 component (dihydrolipoamide acetyltransferase)
MTTQPNYQEIKMPRLGLTMTEGTLVRWLKTEGDIVTPGDMLFEFESDKSLMEFESPAAGKLGKLLIPEGETVPCGTVLAHLIFTGTEPNKTTTAESAQTNNLVVAQSEPAVSKDRSKLGVIEATPAAKRLAYQSGLSLGDISGRGPRGRIQMADVEAAIQTPAYTGGRSGTPLAKRMAHELGLDWTSLTGSGPGGRVVKADILAASQPTVQVPDQPVDAPLPQESNYSTEPLSAVRRVIAQRMSESAFSAPHVTLFTEADATNLVSARSQINSEPGNTVKVSYNALLIAIIARALGDFPYMNSCLINNEIRRYHEVHIALAVDTDRGLLVPVIRNADQLDILAIQQQGDLVIQRALAGKSLPDDLTGGTFTLTNLGMFDVDGFTPVINQPQAAILGVGRIVPKPVVIENDIVIRQMVILSLSFDHRLVDGGPAARFLQRIKHLTERPFALLLPPTTHQQ